MLAELHSQQPNDRYGRRVLVAQASESVWEVAKIDFHIPFRFPLLLKQLKLSASTKNTTCGNRGCHTDSEACATKTGAWPEHAIVFCRDCLFGISYCQGMTLMAAEAGS